MTKVIVGLVPLGATVFLIFTAGGKAAEVGVTHSKDFRALLQERKLAALRYIWKRSYSKMEDMAQKLVGKR